MLISAISLSAIFAVINLQYQRAFVSPVSFWSQAVASAPHSAYAHMMLAARTQDDQASKQLIEEAFRLDPRERNINYIYGVMLQEKDSVLASEKYLLTEKQLSGKPECDLYLARVEMMKQNYSKAISYLESFLPHDPSNDVANNTLVLLYLETDQYDKARAHYNLMNKKGYEVKDKTREELHRQKVI
jgi:tetratricopeptide (TPR) repeat protein